MPVTRDIVQSYTKPRKVMRRLLDAGQREDRAIAILFAGCLIMFVSRWPARAREAHLTETPLVELISNDLFALLFLLPLVMYGLGALTHILAMPFKPKGGWYNARLALFWSLLASSPFLVLSGLVAGFLGEGLQNTIVGAIWFVIFIVLWSLNFREAERAPAGEAA